MKKLLIALLLIVGCKESEPTCHLCITTYSVNDIELRREAEELCDIDFDTVEQLELLTSYQVDSVVVRTWCRRYKSN